jgi:hypothetical protein
VVSLFEALHAAILLLVMWMQQVVRHQLREIQQNNDLLAKQGLCLL